MKKLAVLCSVILGLSQAACYAAEAESPKTFARDPAIAVQKVQFKDRYDITLAGDMYLPKGHLLVE